MAEAVVDCMTCLVQRTKGLQTRGTHVDGAGVTHATLHRWNIVCTLAHYDWNGDRKWYVTDKTVTIHTR